MGEWMDKWMDGWVDAWISGWMGGWVNRWVAEWMYGCMVTRYSSFIITYGKGIKVSPGFPTTPARPGSV